MEARAEAEALLINEESRLELPEVAKRAAFRLAHRELERQVNIEAIIHRAIRFLPESGSTEPVEPDWVAKFIEDCQDVSDERLQAIWAQILAAETANPSSCSKQTLSVLRNIGVKEATKFEVLCRSAWTDDRDSFFVPLGWGQDPATATQMNVSSLVDLDSLGLIHLSMDYIRTFSVGQAFWSGTREFICTGRSGGAIRVPSTESGDEFQVPALLFTPCGSELARALVVEPTEDEINGALRAFKSAGPVIEPSFG